MSQAKRQHRIAIAVLKQIGLDKFFGRIHLFSELADDCNSFFGAAIYGTMGHQIS